MTRHPLPLMIVLVLPVAGWLGSGCGPESASPPRIDSSARLDAPTDGGIPTDGESHQRDALEQVDAPPLDGAQVVMVSDIRALQQDPTFGGGLIPPDTRVRVAGAVVTAAGANATLFFIQNPTGPKEYSGILVRRDSYVGALPQEGDVISALEASLVEESRSCNPTEGTCPMRHALRFPTVVSFTAGGTVPTPLAILTEEVVETPAKYDGVVLQLADPDLAVAATASTLLIPVNNGLALYSTFYDFPEPEPVGTRILMAVGPLDLYNRTWEVYPRSALDLVFGGPPPDGGVQQDAGQSDSATTSDAGPCAGSVVISQIYGGGGNTGAPYKADFVELHNRGSTTVNVSGWSVQYAAYSGTSWSRTDLTGESIAPGGYLLVQESSGANGSALPSPDVFGNIMMATSNGKVALVTNQTTLSGSCPTGNASVIDFVGYGSADCYEGSDAAPATDNTTSNQRNDAGCVDTNNNSADFTEDTPTPRNSSTTAYTCSGC